MFENEEENKIDDAPFVEGETSADDNANDTSAEDNGGTADAPVDDISQHEETVAKARGWVPKEDFRGRPEDWQDAKSFLDRNASLQRDIQELRDKLAENERASQDKISRIERVSTSALRKSREQAQAQIEQAKREAVALGDTDEYDRLLKEESSLYDSFIREDQEAKPKPATQEERVTLLPETVSWIDKNPWFNTNKALHNVALGFYEEASERFSSEGERLKYVDERLGAVYPDRFADRAPKAQAKMPSLEGGNRMQGSKPGDLAAKLPADVRAVGERYVKQGLFKDISAYAKEYFED